VALIAVCLLGAVARQAHAWPLTDIAWDPIPYQDIADSDTPTETNVVGGTLGGVFYPALYHAYDGANLCFRIRVNGQPGPPGSFTEFNQVQWAVLLNTAVQAPEDPMEYGLLVSAKGTAQVELRPTANNNSAHATDWAGKARFDDPFLPVIASIPNGAYARWSVAGDGSTFYGDADYFVDVAVPYAYFLAMTGLPARAPLQAAYATSADNNLGNFNKDLPDPGTSWLPSPPASLLPELATSPAALDFGHVLVGASRTLPVTVSNVGSATLESITLGNLTGSGDFTTGVLSPIDYLRPGDSSTQGFATYAPLERGADTGSLTVSSRNAYNGDFVTPLSGNGVAPLSSLSDAMGTVFGRIGTTMTASIVITNNGDGNLSGLGAASNLNGAILAPGSDPFPFSPPSDGSISLSDGASRQYDFTYVPVGRETVTANLLADLVNGSPDGANLPHTILYTLHGTAVGPIYDSVVAPGGTVDFGIQVWKSPPVDEAFLILNVSGDEDGGNHALTDLTLLYYEIVGPDPTMYQLIGFEPGMILGKGQTASLEIRLYPGIITGHLQAQLNIYTDERGPLGEWDGRLFSYDLIVEIVTPEPTTLTLLAFGALGLLVRRRRQARRPSPR